MPHQFGGDPGCLGALPAGKVSLGGINIWLADDSREFCVLFKEYFHNYPDLNFSQVFHSAIELIAALKRMPPPDVILLDYQMPEMNGLEALPHIRQLAPFASVLLVTTFYDLAIQKQALAAGAVAFLRKTEPEIEIISAIRSARAVQSAAMAAKPAASTVRIDDHSPEPA